jgi:hypothetical protein
MLSRLLFAACVLGFAATEVRTAEPPVAHAPGSPPQKLVVYPKAVKLVGPRDEQRVIVLGVWANGQTWDLTHTATITSANAKIATAEKGVIRPVSDGTSTLAVDANGTKATIPVIVEKSLRTCP